MDNCIFCKIVAGEIPSYKVWEDDNYLAFLTIEPLKEGHTIVIPKKHTDYLFDLADDELGELMSVSKKVATKIKEVFKPQSGKVAVLVVGDEVPHVHIHLVPFDSATDLTLAHPRKASPEELKQTLAKLLP